MLISLSEAKEHLRVSNTANDNIITGIIAAKEIQLNQKTKKTWSTDETVNPLAALCLKEMVKSAYDTNYDNEAGINSMLIDLKDIAAGKGVI